jgi:hypothetical protein
MKLIQDIPYSKLNKGALSKKECFAIFETIQEISYETF